MEMMLCYAESEVSQNVVKIAIKQAKKFEAKVCIVHSAVDTSINSDEIKLIEQDMLEIKSQMEKEGIECKIQLLSRNKNKSSGEDIVAFAKDKGIEEIIIGITKTSKVGKFIFGSTAQYVILEAPCPVLTVSKFLPKVLLSD